jgi:hypothetical protein
MQRVVRRIASFLPCIDTSRLAGKLLQESVDVGNLASAYVKAFGRGKLAYECGVDRTRTREKWMLLLVLRKLR